MLFGKLLEGAMDGEENDLTEMELELRQGIQKAKEMAAACKSSADEEAGFATNEAGVSPLPLRNSSTPSSKPTSTTTKSSGRPTSKIS